MKLEPNQNTMLLTECKFHALLVTKGRDDTTGVRITIQSKQIQSENAVRLLGVTIDHRLTFDDHIYDLCRKAAARLNALKRLEGSKFCLFEFLLLPLDMAFFL